MGVVAGPYTGGCALSACEGMFECAYVRVGQINATSWEIYLRATLQLS